MTGVCKTPGYCPGVREGRGKGMSLSRGGHHGDAGDHDRCLRDTPYVGIKYTPGDVAPGARYTVYGGGRVNGSKGSHIRPRTCTATVPPHYALSHCVPLLALVPVRRRVCKSLLSILKSWAPLGRSPSHQQHSQHSQHSPEHSSTTTNPSRAQPASKALSFLCKLAMSWLRKTEYISDSSPPSTRTAASTPGPCVPFLPIKTSALSFFPPE